MASLNNENLQNIQLTLELRSYIEQLNSYIQQRELDFVKYIKDFEKQIYSECENSTRHLIHSYNINIERFSNEFNSSIQANNASLKSK